MQPTHSAPSGSHGTDAAPTKPKLDAPLSSTEPTSGPAGSSYETYQKSHTDGIQAILDSSKQALENGKKWLEDSDLTDKAKELPQKAKELGSQAWAAINGLSTTQKAVGVGLLAAGVAFLATRGQKPKKGKHRKADKGEYIHKAQHSPFEQHSPFGKKPRGMEEPKGGPRGPRPWGTSRYGAAAGPAGKPRVSSGSGYTSAPAPHSPDHGRIGHQGPQPGQRRDQGPATAGGRYDVHTSGSQNPNNLDQLNSAY